MQRRDLAKLGFAFTGLAGGLTALSAPVRAAEVPATGFVSVLEPVFKRLLEDDVPERTSLDDRLANLLQTAAMTVLPAHGGSEALAETFRRALFAGVSAEELLEVLVQTMAVAGMPAVISAERILHAELGEAGMGAPETRPSTAGAAERFEHGLAVEEKLFGREYLYAFHAGLREDERPLQLSLLSSWAYGETFGRAYLTDLERELVLLAALVTSGAREEIEMHVRAAKTLGATRADLIGLLTVLLPYTGFPKVRAGLALVNAVEAEDERRRAIAEAREEALKRLEAKREAKRKAEEKAKAPGPLRAKRRKQRKRPKKPKKRRRPTRPRKRTRKRPPMRPKRALRKKSRTTGRTCGKRKKPRAQPKPNPIPTVSTLPRSPRFPSPRSPPVPAVRARPTRRTARACGKPHGRNPRRQRNPPRVRATGRRSFPIGAKPTSRPSTRRLRSSRRQPKRATMRPRPPL